MIPGIIEIPILYSYFFHCVYTARIKDKHHWNPNKMTIRTVGRMLVKTQHKKKILKIDRRKRAAITIIYLGKTESNILKSMSLFLLEAAYSHETCVMFFLFCIFRVICTNNNISTRFFVIVGNFRTRTAFTKNRINRNNGNSK
jgi:hypothetical protein